MLKKERVQEKLYKGQNDQMDTTLNQIPREPQEIRYAIYDLKAAGHLPAKTRTSLILTLFREMLYIAS